MLSKINIDTSKCLLCRKGIWLFTKDENGYNHLDIFATPEAGASYRCENSNVLDNYLVKNEDRGTYLPNSNVKRLFTNQELWWETIISLAYSIFDNTDEVLEFFNGGDIDNRVWMKSDIEIENLLLELAFQRGIEVDKDDYEDLIKFQL